MLEKANSDYDGNRKEFWAFVGRRTKGRKRAISALRNNAITSTKGKLRIFQSHYQDLGSKSVDDAFDEDWKQEVESKIRECCNMSSACEDSILDREIEPAEIARCLHSLKNNKTGGSDGLVGELLKYGGSGMVNLLHQLFSVVWHVELVPPQWREGLIVNLFKKGDKEVPGNYRGITLLSVVGKAADTPDSGVSRDSGMGRTVVLNVGWEYGVIHRTVGSVLSVSRDYGMGRKMML